MATTLKPTVGRVPANPVQSRQKNNHASPSHQPDPPRRPPEIPRAARTSSIYAVCDNHPCLPSNAKHRPQDRSPLRPTTGAKPSPIPNSKNSNFPNRSTAPCGPRLPRSIPSWLTTVSAFWRFCVLVFPPARLLGVANGHPLAIVVRSRSMPDKNLWARPRRLAPARLKNPSEFANSNRSIFFPIASFLGSATHEPVRNARRANPRRVSPVARCSCAVGHGSLPAAPRKKKNPIRRSKPGSKSRKQSADLPFGGGFMNPLR